MPQPATQASSRWNEPFPPLSALPRRGLSVDQPQGGFAYPFTAYSHNLPEVIGDLVFFYTDDRNQATHPFFLAWLYGFGDAAAETPTGNGVNWEQLPAPTMLSLFGTTQPTFSHSRDVGIYSKTGLRVFDTRTADYCWAPWGTRAVIHEWRTKDAVLRIVEYICKGPDDPEINLPVLCFPSASLLDERSVIQQTPQIREVRVGLVAASARPLILKGGYNCTITVSPSVFEDGSRTKTTLIIAAEPNSGDGRYDPGEEIQPVIQTINRQKPTTYGDFRLEAEGVVRIERPIIGQLQDDPPEVLVQNHALQLYNDGVPCCTCEDFINVYTAIRQLRNAYAELSERAQIVRSIYIANVERFERERQLRQRQKLQIRLSPLCPNFLDLAVSFVNQEETCLHNLFLIISFTHTENNKTYTSIGPTSAQIVYSSTFRNGNDAPPACGMPERYTLGGSWPHYWAYFPQVDSGTTASVTTRLYFDGAEPSWNIVVIADAYALDKTYPVGPSGSPIPDHAMGFGPVGPLAVAARLVPGVAYRSTGLLTASDVDKCFNAETEIL